MMHSRCMKHPTFPWHFSEMPAGATTRKAKMESSKTMTFLIGKEISTKACHVPPAYTLLHTHAPADS